MSTKKDVMEKEVEKATAEAAAPEAVEKKIDVESLVEKGKKGNLSAIDLDEAMENMDFDMDSLEKLYEAFEDNGVALPDDISTSEMNEIEHEVERFGGGENMERMLEQEGLSIDELADYAKNIALNVVHWFTVDDLVYLKRGGRISPTVAFVGNTLGLKPVIHVDNEGKLVSVEKIRGRKNAINHLAEKYASLALDKENGTVFISHADCIEDANTLAAILKEKHGVEVKLITYIGPVIGAHAGPGTLALFFVGKER